MRGHVLICSRTLIFFHYCTARMNASFVCAQAVFILYPLFLVGFLWESILDSWCHHGNKTYINSLTRPRPPLLFVLTSLSSFFCPFSGFCFSPIKKKKKTCDDARWIDHRRFTTRIFKSCILSVILRVTRRHTIITS